VLYDGMMRWVMENAMNKAAADKIAWAPHVKDVDAKAQESLRALVQRIQATTGRACHNAPFAADPRSGGDEPVWCEDSAIEIHTEKRK
jgi:hypothetical protein